ncbi:hypothetical protein DL765_002138 [Monosporascus sp. GIB2]|nr:hypothetical protein DL765_002138 [Monosporascus sp. GIB2]
MLFQLPSAVNSTDGHLSLTRVSLKTTLGPRAVSATSNIPNRAPAYLCFHFIFAYGVLSSRTLKQWSGIDHKESPRYDLRNESAYADAVENYAFFVGAISSVTFAAVEREYVNRAGFVYTVTRAAYGLVYILIDHPLWSQIRGVTWWIGNGSCLYLLWKASGKLNRCLVPAVF